MIDQKDEASRQDEPIISSGSLRLDIALGTGGYPSGSIIEISGKTTSGKTVLSMHGIKEAQRTGRLCALIDADRSLDVSFARRIGVKFSTLYYVDPESTEQALWTIETLAQSGLFALIVLDSIPSLNPSGWAPGIEMEQIEILNDELISSSLHRLSHILAKTGTNVIFVNDLKQRMSAVYHHLSKNPRRIALKLLADFRIRLENQEQLLHNEEIVGERIQARVIKNRFFPLLNATYFDIIFKQGINKSAEIFALGIHTRLIRNLSEGYFYQTVHLGKTASQALHFLEENRQIREDAEKNIGQAFMPLNLNAAT